MDKLARMAYEQNSASLPKPSILRIIEVPATRIEVMEIKLGAPKWAMKIIRYLNANEVPNDRRGARKVKNQAT